MNHRSRFPAKACLVLGLVAGLTACGGGGGSSAPGPATTTPGIRAQEITITPPANRAPEAVGTIPDQTLAEDGNALSVDVAQYFSDPDGDSLTWSARSGDPGVVTAGMSGSTVTLTPVSDGTATVMVTAGDGHAEAVQSIAVTVRQSQSREQPVNGTDAGEPASVTQSSLYRSRRSRLTGVKFVVAGSKRKTEHFPHTVFLRISPEPDGAVLGVVWVSATTLPGGAGRAHVTFSDRIGETLSPMVQMLGPGFHWRRGGHASMFQGGSIEKTAFLFSCR